MTSRIRTAEASAPLSSAPSDARQRAIVDAALDRVVISDEHGRVTYSNKSAEQTFGYPGSEAIGRELADVIVPARGETLIGDGSRNI